MENFEINDRLISHVMDDEKMAKSKGFRGECIDLAYAMDAALPDCREKSLAMTKLEEVLMWFNKGLARSDG